MKTRNGFVSNSSSASFIVRVGEQNWKTVADIAGHMALERGKTYLDDEEDNERNEALFYEIEKLASSRGRDVGVSFGCSNGSTQICKVGDYFYIDTTRNESWELPSAASFGDGYGHVPKEIQDNLIDATGRNNELMDILGENINAHLTEWYEVRNFIAKYFDIEHHELIG